MVYSLIPDSDIQGHVARIHLSADSATDRVVLPDAQFLLSAKFTKSGADLVLTDGDGHKLIVENYFNLLKRPDLVAEGGGTLSSHVVESLAGPVAPAHFAQVGVPAGAVAIGKVERLGGSATVQHANGVTQELQVGDAVMQGDVVETRDDSQLGISFADGTAFNMGTNARMVLSELVYGGAGAQNSAVFNVVKGTISFVAGQVAKTGDMRIITPISTMGIRGTSVNLVVKTDAFGNAISVTHSLMADYDGTVSAYNILDTATNAIIASVNTTDSVVVVSAAANLTYLAQVMQKPPEMVQMEIGIAQILIPMFLSNPVNLTNAPQLQDLLPKSAGALTNSEVFADSHVITETISGTISPPHPPNTPKPGDVNIPDQIITVVLPANLAPLIHIDPAATLVEAANSDPGIAVSVAAVIKSDLDGTVAYDTNALFADHWESLGNGILAKLGNYGAVALNTVGVTAAVLLAGNWVDRSGDLGNGVFSKVVMLHDANGASVSETVEVNVNANSLTYALDNAKADPLDTGQLVTEHFTIPVIDDDGAKNSAVATFTIEGRNDAPVAVNDSYIAALGHVLHIPANGVLANDFDAEHAQLSASLVGIVASTAAAGSLSLSGGTAFILNSYFDPPGWSNSDGVGVGSTIQIFDSHSSSGSGLSLSAPSIVTLTFLGSDAGYENSFFFDGTALFENHADAVGSVVDGLQGDAGLLDVLFRSITPGNEDAVNGGAINPNVLLGFTLVNDHRAYAFFDDVATGDHDFDDMVVRIDISPIDHSADGILKLNADGSFDYQPYFSGDFGFTYNANDGALNSASPATVSIGVGVGADTIDFSSSAKDAQVTLSDTPNGSSFTSAATGQQTLADGINNVTAGSGNDTITGNNSGGLLNGGAGNDTIKGGSGNDILIGGKGNDQLTGGGGNDTFVFRPAFGHDTISDFNVGDAVNHDVLDLRGLGFTSIADVLNHTDLGANALIHAGADDISLTLVTKAALALHAGDILV